MLNAYLGMKNLHRKTLQLAVMGLPGAIEFGPEFLGNQKVNIKGSHKALQH
jgi:hypothetical protein